MAISFPNETYEYRVAREKLLQAEIALRDQIEEVARMRRSLPPGGAVTEEYVLSDLEGGTVRLQNLLPDNRKSLLVYSYMFGPDDKSPCPACTAIMDAADAQEKHLGPQGAKLVVVMSGTREQARSVRKARNWQNLAIYADAGAYNRAYHGEKDGNQEPMLNVFDRDQGGNFRHRWGTEMLHAPLDGHPRHVDLMWPLWGWLDVTPHGRGEIWHVDPVKV